MDISMCGLRKVRAKNNADAQPSASPGTKVEVLEFRSQELETATNNFSGDALLWEGRYGSVYKGYMQDLDKPVAVEKLSREGYKGMLLSEVLLRGRLNHKNLIEMIGYVDEPGKCFLINEYMPLGSLDMHLRGVPPNNERLDWFTRVKIALDVAKGLRYLHNDAKPPVVYKCLNSSSILLDEEYCAKLSDFSLANCGHYNEIISRDGYYDFEYEGKRSLCEASDVYSFGVLLLELITGCLPSRTLADEVIALMRDKKRRHKIFSVAADPEPEVCYLFPELAIEKAVRLAFWCLREPPFSRPSMKEVARRLGSEVFANSVPIARTKEAYLRGQKTNLSWKRPIRFTSDDMPGESYWRAQKRKWWWEELRRSWLTKEGWKQPRRIASLPMAETKDEGAHKTNTEGETTN